MAYIKKFDPFDNHSEILSDEEVKKLKEYKGKHSLLEKNNEQNKKMEFKKNTNWKELAKLVYENIKK